MQNKQKYEIQVYCVNDTIFIGKEVAPEKTISPITSSSQSTRRKK